MAAPITPNYESANRRRSARSLKSNVRQTGTDRSSTRCVASDPSSQSLPTPRCGTHPVIDATLSVMHRKRRAALRNDVHRIETEWQTAPAVPCAQLRLPADFIANRNPMEHHPEHRCNFLLVTISVSRSRALAPLAALPLNGTISRNVFSSVPLLRFHRGCIFNPHVIPQHPSSFSAF